MSNLKLAVARRNDIALDVGERAAVVTHLRTFEKVQLPPGSWELVDGSAGGDGDDFDEVCVVGVEDNGGEHIFELEELFQRHLLVHPETGEEWVRLKGTDSLMNLGLEMVKHRVADCNIQLGHAQAGFGIEIAVFRRPRAAGMQTYWSLLSVYKGLRLTAFKYPSNWIQRCLPRWLRAFEQTFGFSDSSVVLSCSHSDSSDKKRAMPWHERCLPFPGIATWALLLLAFRWQCLPREGGGFSSAQDRKSCSLFATALMALISADGDASWDFDVVLVRKWRSPWPRPSWVAVGP